MDGIFCADCGAKVSEPLLLIPVKREPCPNCSSAARTYTAPAVDKTMTQLRMTSGNYEIIHFQGNGTRPPWSS